MASGKRRSPPLTALPILTLLALLPASALKLENYLDPSSSTVDAEASRSLEYRQPRFFFVSTTSTTITSVIITSTSCFTTTAAITTTCAKRKKRSFIDDTRIRFDGHEISYEEWIAPNSVQEEDQTPSSSQPVSELVPSRSASDEADSPLAAELKSRDPRFFFYYSTFVSTSTSFFTTTTATTTFTLISCTPASAISLCGVIG